MNSRRLLLALILLITIGTPVVANLVMQDRGVTVETYSVEQRTVRSSVFTSGVLAYREEVELRSEVIGRVEEVNVEEGDRVAKGDVILRLNQDQFRAQVEQQQANVRLQEIAIERQEVLLENLERQVARQRELFAKDLLSSDAFEAADNELKRARIDLRSRRESALQARAALAQAEDNLARTEIRSPIDGIVILLAVEVGEAVISGTTNIPGATLAVVADPSVLLSKVQVDETDIALVSLGQEASIFAAAFPDTPLPGVVEKTAISARQASGQQNLSFEVLIRITDSDKLAVRPGMSCRAEIHTESSDNALAVPLQSVFYDENAPGRQEQPYVYVADGNQAERREVTLGLSSDSYMEIRGGLDVGDQVITGPFRTLRDMKDGDAIKVPDRDSPDEGGVG